MNESREHTLELTIAAVRPWQAGSVPWPDEQLVEAVPSWARLGWKAAKIAEILQVDVSRVQSALARKGEDGDRDK